MRQENWPLARRFAQAILHREIFHYNQHMLQTWGRYFFIQNVMSFEQGPRDSESELGIDYHQHFSGDLRQILMTGEREWLANAAELHRWDTGEMWTVVMLPRLTEGRLKPEDYEDLKRFCPIMLDAMSRQRIKRTKSQIMARILAALDPEE